MAHNSNSHDATWLPTSQTEMFSVYAGNARSSCLVAGAVANCSTHADLPYYVIYTCNIFFFLSRGEGRQVTPVIPCIRPCLSQEIKEVRVFHVRPYGAAANACAVELPYS